ncbi:hypothetical protein PUN28_014267 [Cardiocondyla obscurior]|uniref:Transmembrane protein n=1 Tax=Cardiocondyla obscurior TaxID=286306 RepID=A0AAW2F485_9HYME
MATRFPLLFARKEKNLERARSLARFHGERDSFSSVIQYPQRKTPRKNASSTFLAAFLFFSVLVLDLFSRLLPSEIKVKTL